MLCKPMLEFTAKKRTAREEDGKGKKTDREGRGEGSEWRRTGGWGGARVCVEGAMRGILIVLLLQNKH